MPVKPITTAAQHSLEPIDAPKSERVIKPPQKNRVDRKNSVLIHRIADWLDSRYLRKNFWFDISSTPPYMAIADSDSTASKAISQRTDFQCQPSQEKVGAASSSTPFS